jgi:hypothetical protein
MLHVKGGEVNENVDVSRAGAFVFLPRSTVKQKRFPAGR